MCFQTLRTHCQPSRAALPPGPDPETAASDEQGPKYSTRDIGSTEKDGSLRSLAENVEIAMSLSFPCLSIRRNTNLTKAVNLHCPLSRNIDPS